MEWWAMNWRSFFYHRMQLPPKGIWISFCKQKMKMKVKTIIILFLHMLSSLEIPEDAIILADVFCAMGLPGVVSNSVSFSF